jgi:hypothetical protein
VLQNQDTKVWNQIQKDLRFQVLFSVYRLTHSGFFENLWESNQTLLPKVNLSLMTCSTNVQINKNYGDKKVFILRVQTKLINSVSRLRFSRL